APFIKVDAIKFKEVSYFGRDVEFMIRDLVDMSLRIVQEEKMELVKEKAEEEANKKIVRLLVPEMKKQKQVKYPFEMLFPNMEEDDEQDKAENEEENNVVKKRQQIKQLLELGELEDKEVEIEI